METEHGESIYSADVTIDAHPYDVKIAPDSMLISKELDTDND